MASILVVDDKPDLLALSVRHLERNGHRCVGAASVREAMAAWAREPFELVVCDLLMPDASGLSLLEQLSGATPQTAVIVTTGVEDVRVADAALKLGAYGYMIKPVDPVSLLINVSSALRRRDLELKHLALSEESADLLARRTAGFMATIEEDRTQIRALQASFEEAVVGLSALLEVRAATRSAHTYRVGRFAALIARGAGVAGADLERLRLAMALHDVAMGLLPSGTVDHEEALSDEQRLVMAQHTRVGYRVLALFDSPVLKLGAVIALGHHERWDGSGYPDGLAGRRVPIEARIAALADGFDARTRPRPDRPAMLPAAAAADIERDAGTAYDPDLVAAFRAVLPEVYRIRSKYDGETSAGASGPGTGR